MRKEKKMLKIEKGVSYGRSRGFFGEERENRREIGGDGSGGRRRKAGGNRAK